MSSPSEFKCEDDADLFDDIRGVIHPEFVPVNQAVNQRFNFTSSEKGTQKLFSKRSTQGIVPELMALTVFDQYENDYLHLLTLSCDFFFNRLSWISTVNVSRCHRMLSNKTCLKGVSNSGVNIWQVYKC